MTTQSDDSDPNAELVLMNDDDPIDEVMRQKIANRLSWIKRCRFLVVTWFVKFWNGKLTLSDVLRARK